MEILKKARILNCQTPVWVEEKPGVKKHQTKLFAIPKKHQQIGYRKIRAKSEVFLNERTRLGHYINEQGKKPNIKEGISQLKHQ